MFGKDSLKTKSTVKIDGVEYSYFSIKEAEKKLGVDLSKMPISLRIVFENLLRFEDDKYVKTEDIKAFTKWLEKKSSDHEISYLPARVLMQDFTGVPAIVDLAAMRDAMQRLGGDPNKINPLSPVDLVIDHSVQVDKFGDLKAFDENVRLEMQRNHERYEFLKWGQKSFANFRVVPPGTGICHQVNLEYLSKIVWKNQNFLYPDTLVGTDSHTTMVNGLSVLGWGVGGIEAEAVMLGQPMSMLIPEVIGVRLVGSMKDPANATDLVLTITEILRKKGVVNKFVEFFGSGLSTLSIADRATIANMAPEYGATCGFFPVDEETIKYLRLSNRDEHQINLVREYAKLQGLWRDENTDDLVFTDVLEIDLSKIEPSLAGPKRPQDRVLLSNVTKNFVNELPGLSKTAQNQDKVIKVEGKDFNLNNGDVVIAAITSCTNTSNPSVMIAAGLVAKKAAELGLNVKPWVKTSLAPGSKVVSEYLTESGLQKYLDELGFNVVGYGCTTCIGNSGPLNQEIEDAITQNELVVAAVLSGNRNFEGRVHPLTRANYLASPPLVVAYAIAGSMKIDLSKDPIAKTKDGKEVYLSDIWPKADEINQVMQASVKAKMFKEKYAEVFDGTEEWKKIEIKEGLNYKWQEQSTYIANPPYFEKMGVNPQNFKDIVNANILAVFGDSITTDHISPAGNISKTSPAAKYLLDKGVKIEDFNSYGARRGNHEVMMRGTFANIRIKNMLVPGVEGGITKFVETGELMSIYDAAMLYQKANKPLVIFAGKEYGSGSSRDWAAKGTKLLGIKAVIAESFERIHRSNLVLMGVLPLCFKDNISVKDLGLKGDELISIIGLDKITPKMEVFCEITRSNGDKDLIPLISRIDTENEVDYINNDGILPFVIRKFINA